ncbi:MAG: NAD(P)/FAD-dependent oxidoreductase [Devosia sp.]|uniref:ArsO family NAD(P)H-dependent flavin-containing monooxygenase n=1 Tax=Devosia sp. TaxID=1871048 RepID=UPI001AC3B75B|nr:ArsO family NAD(P)H-dependent flavin-containing monooxygenase [Devosia sp.]MBN9317885.1 NAD(P)/FAD-dependent oxidoreductase [Devosia sp.]
MTELFDVVIIGGGQAGLAVAYYLRRAGLSFIVLDNATSAGGAWPHAWDSLRLFSPAQFSSLPGWQMPKASSGEYPTRDEVVDYLTRYEERYAFPIERPVDVLNVKTTDGHFVVEADSRSWAAKMVVSATGTWSEPFIPDIPGMSSFSGQQLHSAHYRSPTGFTGQRVLVVGGGNSGAQIHAELSEVADSTWVTLTKPVFLPDDVDGRVLFERATARVLGADNGASVGSLGDIVMVAPVRAARDRGDLQSVRLFERFTPSGVTWQDGTESAVDAIIWCTGFRPALKHLQALGVVEADGRIATENGQSTRQLGLFLAGYGNWVSPASATLIGAGRSARELVPVILAALSKAV